MNNGLSILNVSTDLQLVAKGVIIVVAIALDNAWRSSLLHSLGSDRKPQVAAGRQNLGSAPERRARCQPNACARGATPADTRRNRENREPAWILYPNLLQPGCTRGIRYPLRLGGTGGKARAAPLDTPAT